ncbi:MAG: hypothetical protein K6T30_03935 [Alicyclobacillus sp.]|nr:hypothetical protein [Alicyclobacillus sp.]
MTKLTTLQSHVAKRGMVMGAHSEGDGQTPSRVRDGSRWASVRREDLERLDLVAPWEEFLYTPLGEEIPKEVTDEDV